MSFIDELRPLVRLRWLQSLVLAGLLTAVGIVAFRLKFSVLDLDIWWHLKTGDWIVQHAAFPHNGLFTWTATERAWIAYSWGYEVLLSRAYAWFGLIGIGLYGTLLTMGVAFSIYWMARRLSRDFWLACLLAVVACSAFLFNLMPRPVFFSMMLFAVTLTLLLEAQRTRREKLLYWLPLVFVLWANLHIQFVYGLLVVGVFVGVNLAQRLAAGAGWRPEWLQVPTLPAGKLLLVLAACILATCIGPYSFHLYGVVWQYAHAKVPYRMIMELQPLTFRDYSHYVQLLLMGFAFFAVGRERKVDLFKLLLLAVTAAIAFHTMRDSWLICIAAAGCVADSFAAKGEVEESWRQNFAAVALTAVLLAVFARSADFTTRGLDRAISGFLPVNAVNYVRQHPAPGPLYNTMDWGGFLSWYMPEREVAIDGRTDLYGDDLEAQFFNTSNGVPGYAEDAYLSQAGMVIVQKKKNLAKLLESDARFQLVYEDALAAVFVRR